jgi:lipoate---protein ligase
LSFDNRWRFIPLLDAPGKIQMALDTWLFQQHCLGLHPPTLRFYTWSPIAISLGYHQRQYPDHWRDLTWDGQPIELVRRPSGGRAVLHQGDLTYAVITSTQSGNRRQAYEEICQFLVEGWRSLHQPLHYGHAGRGYIHNPNCFGTATSADLVLSNGMKLIGSAQLRNGDHVLQHGSIRLEPDPALFQQVFGIPLGESDVRINLSISTLIETLKASASQCFATEWIDQPLSEQEWQALQGSFQASRLGSQTK